MLMNYKKIKALKYSIMFLIVVASVLSCDCSSSKKNPPPPSPEAIQEKRIEARRDFLEKERESIEAYQKDYNLEMERTGTGLYYTITKKSGDTILVETEDWVEYAYKIYSLQGELLYSSDDLGIVTLKVDKMDTEIGVHEALKLMALGDEGLFILPSHLAFGVAGDMNKVQPMTPLVYEIIILNIKKSKS